MRALAAELWRPPPAETITERKFGKGRVVWGQTAGEVLLSDGVLPDAEFQIKNEKPEPDTPGIDWIHRRDGPMDIYFVCNRHDLPRMLEATFRVSGRRPEFWDPVTGTCRDAGAYTQTGKRTSVPFSLPPYGSTFVVFRKEIPAAQNGTLQSNGPRLTKISDITGPWDVAFDPRLGGPGKVVFDTLEDWSQRPEQGIRHFSGTAVYGKAFDLPAEASTQLHAGKKLHLDLGEVRELAEVKLNGKNLGVVWCPPWRVEIGDAVLEKDNRVEIEVVNLWPNRIIGDAALPPEKRLTRTNIRAFKADSPLMPSGLLGPVCLQASP